MLVENSEKLFLEISSENGKYFTTINSFLAFYVFNYLEQPKSIKLQFINRKSKFPPGTSLIPLKLDKVDSLDRPENPNVTDLKLPVFHKGSNIFISGLCAVCREIVKSVPESSDLLGFKQSCLLSPAETSIWTRFCELETVRDFNKILSQTDGEAYRIPEMFLRFEGHMKLPVRMHNIYKLAREKANQEVRPKGKGKVVIECNIPKESLEIEHTFSEGISFTIADLILYPIFKLASLIFPPSFKFEGHFPIVKTWLDSIEIFDNQCFTHLQSLIDIDSMSHESFKVTDFLLERPEKRETSNRDSNSLYKSDPKRYQPRSRMFTSQNEVDARLEKLAPLGLSHSTDDSYDFGDMDQFDWSSIDSDHLEKSSLPEKRLDRKRQQLTNLANAVTNLVDGNHSNVKIVDFCSGTGPLGLLLAKKLPQCTIVILENKAISIELARKRSLELNLTNCLFYQTNLDYFEGKFDIGCSLHACGTATDIVIDKCLKAEAGFVSCPCCYGSIQPMPHLQYPQSKAIKSVLIQKDFLYLAHTADQAHQEGTKNTKPETIEQGRKCMEIVDTDRRMRAEELGYSVIFTKLQPENCTPKNHLLVGRFCK